MVGIARLLNVKPCEDCAEDGDVISSSEEPSKPSPPDTVFIRLTLVIIAAKKFLK